MDRAMQIAPPSPLLEREIVEHVARTLGQGRQVLLGLSQAPPAFRASEERWVLRLEPAEAGAVVAVRGLAYVGEDPMWGEAFGRAPGDDGFLPVAIIRREGAAALLQGVEELLHWSEGSTADVEEGVEEAATDTDELISDSEKEEEAAEGGALARWGVELVAEARKGRIERPLHRDEETDKVIDVLGKKTKAGAMLVAEAGVGKTAVVEGLAFRVLDGAVPASLRGKKIFSVNVGMLTAGASHMNEGEGRWKSIVDEARERDDVILFIDEAHLIVDPRSNFAEMSKEDLARGRILIVGATTPQEFRAIEKNSALLRRFTPIRIEELPPEKAVDVVMARREGLEAHHGLSIPGDILSRTVYEAKWVHPDRMLPDLPLDLVDQAAARAAREGAGVLEADHVHQVMASWKGLPVEQLGLVRPAREYFDDLAGRLQNRVLGQETCVNAVVEALWQQSQLPRREARVGVRASFILTGPTGSGKTELAKAVADELFGKERVVRIDCASLSQEHEVARLVGAPPGYVGHDLGGQLTNGARAKGFGVLLFDEAEKAHPVFATSILLSLLDEGYVVDQNTGNRIDVSQFIVFLTTNLGGGDDPPGFGRGGEQWSAEGARAAVAAHFPPEVVGRFEGRLLAFQPLARDVHIEIARRELDRLTSELASREPAIGLRVNPEALALVVDTEAGAVNRLGARAVKAAAHRRLTNKVLELLARHPDESGAIAVDVDGSRFRFVFTPEGADVGAL